METLTLEQKIKQQPIDWKDDLRVQADGIVSKTLVDMPTGTITVFAFDKGQGLSEHAAPFDAFVHLLEGSMEITIGGTPHTVSGGESILMPADVPHGLKAVAPSKMLLIMIRPPK